MTQLQHGRDGFIALLQSAAAPAGGVPLRRAGSHAWRLPVLNDMVPATIEAREQDIVGPTARPLI